MKRGDLVIVSARAEYAGKPRPAVIIQSNAYPINSVTVCLITSVPIGSNDLRLKLSPDQTNNLEQESWIMVDKILTVPRQKVVRVFGKLNKEQIARLNWIIAVFLDLSTVRPPA